MAKDKPILIGCPQYCKLVRGTCQCDEDGHYLLGPDGTFALNHVRCGQHDGRCMETLCALHRFNRRGPATWFPSQLLAMDEPAPRRGRPRRTPAGGKMDILC